MVDIGRADCDIDRVSWFRDFRKLVCREDCSDDKPWMAFTSMVKKSASDINETTSSFSSLRKDKQKSARQHNYAQDIRVWGMISVRLGRGRTRERERRRTCRKFIWIDLRWWTYSKARMNWVLRSHQLIKNFEWILSWRVEMSRASWSHVGWISAGRHSERRET